MFDTEIFAGYSKILVHRTSGSQSELRSDDCRLMGYVRHHIHMVVFDDSYVSSTFMPNNHDEKSSARTKFVKTDLSCFDA